MSRRVRTLALVVACITAGAGISAASYSSPAPATEQFLVFSKFDPELESYGYVDRRLKWPNPIVKVCWESLESESTSRMVETAVENSWQAAANIQFTGWKQCVAGEMGIRIKVVDEAQAPDSKVGSTLDGV